MSIKINNKLIADKTPIDTNTNLGNSDEKVPSQKAVKTYVDNKIPAMPTVPTKLSEFTDDLGSTPIHTHSQYISEVSMNNLSDVIISNLTDGDIIVYDSNINKWKNDKASASISVTYDASTSTLNIT